MCGVRQFQTCNHKVVASLTHWIRFLLSWKTNICICVIQILWVLRFPSAHVHCSWWYKFLFRMCFLSTSNGFPICPDISGSVCRTPPSVTSPGAEGAATGRGSGQHAGTAQPELYLNIHHFITGWTISFKHASMHFSLTFICHLFFHPHHLCLWCYYHLVA